MRAALLCGSSFWTPPAASLEQLVQFRGAIWPKLGLSLPWGPRPFALDNIMAVDSLEAYTPEQRAQIITSYTALGFQTAPQGPCVDAGYHQELPACDFRGNFNAYLDLSELWERARVRVNHFLRPDQGVAGLDWDVDDCERELTPLFSTPRAQALMRIVTLAWEPGGRYGYNNDWWVRMSQWMARTFPHALRCWHLPADQDAPTGQDDESRGFTNGECWARVAPYGHVFLVQNAGYTDGGSPMPTPKFLRDFTDQFNPHVDGSLPQRFAPGNRFGWPGFSAWGPDKGIVALPAEYWAYAGYWHNYPFEAAIELGHAAMEAGAVGFFDGGSL